MKIRIQLLSLSLSLSPSISLSVSFPLSLSLFSFNPLLLFFFSSLSRYLYFSLCLSLYLCNDSLSYFSTYFTPPSFPSSLSLTLPVDRYNSVPSLHSLPFSCSHSHAHNRLVFFFKIFSFLLRLSRIQLI